MGEGTALILIAGLLISVIILAYRSHVKDRTLDMIIGKYERQYEKMDRLIQLHKQLLENDTKIHEGYRRITDLQGELLKIIRDDYR